MKSKYLWLLVSASAAALVGYHFSKELSAYPPFKQIKQYLYDRYNG